MQIPASSVRVFVPASELDDDEAQAMTSIPDDRDADSGWLDVADGDFGVLVEADPEPGWQIDSDAGSLFCPSRQRLRTLAGMLSVRDQFPDVIGERFVPDDAVDHATRELESMRFKAGLKTYVLESAWHIPLRWFLAFDADERIVDPGVPMLRYETDLRNGVARVEYAAGVASEAGLADEVTELVADFGRWLAEFPRDSSRVMLDYGGLASLMSADDLLKDSSVADMKHAVAALDAGELEESARSYYELNARWVQVRAFQSAS